MEYHDLLPMPFTREALDHVVGRVQQVKRIADVPFALENPSDMRSSVRRRWVKPSS